MTVKTRGKKIAFIILIALLVFALTFSATMFVIIKIGEKRLKESLVADEMISATDDYDYEADVYHKGKAYIYNEDIVNILLLGVDKYVEETEKQGQADAIYLVSLNTKAKKVKIFSISRNAITRVNLFDAFGNYYTFENQQICLAYSYGKTDEQSSENCARSVSNLLYGVPINGYYTVYLHMIGELVDAVGGVNVTLTEAMPKTFPYKKVGDRVRITGKNALPYVTERGETQVLRLERHKAFIKDFIAAAKKAVAKDLSLPLDMYKKLSNRSVTNVESSSAVYMATEVLGSDYEIISIPGKTGFDGTYETFEVDGDALYEIVLENFYIEKK